MFKKFFSRKGMRKSPRDRRLSSDYNSAQQLMRESSIFSFEGRGTPPERYRLIFSGVGFRRRSNGEVVIAENHEVILELGAAYPRMVPNLAWHTPIFHPNISNNGVVCLGGYGTHWVPSLTLSELCTMLWDMIRYKNFDTESPYNREAAAWAKTQTQYAFPSDRRSIRDRIENSGTGENPEQAKPSVGIEIVESGVEVVRRPPQPDNGIVFLD